MQISIMLFMNYENEGRWHSHKDADFFQFNQTIACLNSTICMIHGRNLQFWWRNQIFCQTWKKGGFTCLWLLAYNAKGINTTTMQSHKLCESRACALLSGFMDKDGFYWVITGNYYHQNSLDQPYSVYCWCHADQPIGIIKLVY